MSILYLFLVVFLDTRNKFLIIIIIIITSLHIREGTAHEGVPNRAFGFVSCFLITAYSLRKVSKMLTGPNCSPLASR